MAGYGNASRGYSTYSTPSSDDYWSSTSYDPDHVCRPVIIDDEGRKRPIISYGADQNADHYVTKTETIFQQHVHSPVEFEYKHRQRWTEDPYGAENFRRPMASVNGRPQNVEEFITEVQIDASRPKVAPWDVSYRRQAPRSSCYEGYDEYNGFHNKDLLKPSGNAHRNDSYDDYHRKQGSNVGPTMITSGGWARPTHSAWATPPNASLCGATNDINAAMMLLKEVAKPSAITSPSPYWYREPAYTETIDNKEAARRYKTGPFSREGTIDSREAARRYNDSAV